MSTCDGGDGTGDAIVVFSGRAALWWLRVLKAGFRHCFVLIRSRGTWIVYNPLSHRTEIVALRGLGGAELARFFAGHGYTVLWTRTRPAPARPAPWRPFTCVEAVKRGLGIQAGHVWTPWQLYRYMIKNIK